MSREFDGLFTATDQHFVVDLGGLAGSDGGPLTLVALWKPADDDGGLIHGRNGAGTPMFALHASTGNYYGINDFTGGPSVVLNEFQLIGMQKADGVATYRWHLYRYDNDTWTHADSSTTGDSADGPLAEIWLGQSFGRTDGVIAVLGALAGELGDDAAWEVAGLHTSLQAWVDSGLSAVWPMNQEADEDLIVDVVGSADEVARTAVVPQVSAEVPAGFDWTLSGGAARTPETVAVLAAIPTPVVSTGTSIFRPTVHAAVAIPTPTVTGNGAGIKTASAVGEVLWEDGLSISVTLESGQPIDSSVDALNASIHTEPLISAFAQPALASTTTLPAEPVAEQPPTTGGGDEPAGTVDVGDAVELTFSTITGATVFVTWYDPDGAVVVDQEFVPENPSGSGDHPYTFLPTRPGMWTAVFVASGAATAAEAYHVRAQPIPGPVPLATVDEFRELFRPMTNAEQNLARRLLRYASALLRGRFPDLDGRIARGVLDSDVVGLATINMVLRVMRNPAGLPPLASERVGPFSRSYFDDGAAGLLVVTAAEEAMVTPPAASATAIGTVMARPGLARWPVGVRTNRELRRWW